MLLNAISTDVFHYHTGLADSAESSVKAIDYFHLLHKERQIHPKLETRLMRTLGG